MALALLVIWPVVALAVEVVLVAMGVVVSAAARFVLRRPWTVRAVARGGRDHRHEWQVVGWRASGALVDGVAEALRTGRELPGGAITYGAPPEPLPPVGGSTAQ